MIPDTDKATGASRTRLFVYNGGFLTQKRLKRILSLTGFDIRLGIPQSEDCVGVWGNSPTAHRGLRVAEKHEVPVLRIEDALLRSLHPGREGEPPLGLLLDRSGLHFDASRPSDLEKILINDPLDNTALLNRARAAIERIKELHLSKYSAFDLDEAPPDPGYVLVVDQTVGDAAVTASGADRARFLEMLFVAQEENPGAQILIKTHPETQAGHRQGHFTDQDLSDRISLFDAPISPWPLLEGAVAVYTVSSQLGFEAILAGHKPRVFGQPFYAGWGLTQDENPIARRQRNLTRAQLFAAAMLLYPTWYDPYRDEICDLEMALDTLEAQTRAWRQDHKGWTASGMRLWKRKHMQQIFGRHGKLRFTSAQPEHSDRPHMVWASQARNTEGAVRVEDGFLRSRGLGAELVPPLSLVTDEIGIYYDPTKPSRLEDLISLRETLRPDQEMRAERLLERLLAEGLSKYNTGQPAPTLPEGHRILVPGQVEDDASILLGTGAVRSNMDLLQAARDANPNAILIYKPHPDVEAGLREGKIDATVLADVVVPHTDPAALLTQVQEVWTMTSLLGFEALLRRVKVTTLGAPFYAGWGLTTDLGVVPARRGARPSLLGLVHATLIDYPRYFDPVTGQACPVEVAVERLSQGNAAATGPINRLLSKLQGAFATHAHFWR
ncbi:MULTISPECIES: capsular polysaccharide biosynthesis protein [unclassified Ruegeria]|uniref:capsular polysaccharide biosynthesis protein n=1 Tax=unclassified Ruegeria TaxID=2625375 RepID=UPI001489050F|nr:MULTISPECIES: capsular polysaccharide biosynthesis protein [unclassified Ruegeria]NOD74990.1 capsular polysaccharide biosynthesis protein [Ruegeria sp. HKCCD4332]NOD86951.1 capsular polysaccharide biosynthesis protein [Ruegeria sp. HKCCD4318]NOE12506.1 capsular polysaccharide biosynthesis protein [Ruegeria sp. HKCCD4318-2]NOG09329.1 capsular polysaccharide biosynthesis protein [Ruegeria sp. HKCCD4315]